MRDPTDNTLSPEAVKMIVDKSQRERFYESNATMRLGLLCTLRGDIAWLADSHETLRQDNTRLKKVLDILQPLIAAAKDFHEAQDRCQRVPNDGSIQDRMAYDTAWAAGQELLCVVRNMDVLELL